ncbi:MAG: hypothetical protein AAGH68_11035 [Pseudomonadota bacterium]
MFQPTIRRSVVLMFAVVLALCACGKGGPSGSSSAGDAGLSASASSSEPPQYATSAEQFAGLQRAGLSGDYRAFAGHLKAEDPQAVTTKLQQSFGGRPFDVYTRAAKPGEDAHRRLVELRSTTGRMYLYVALDKVPGGWRVADYRLDRKRAAVSTQL